MKLKGCIMLLSLYSYLRYLLENKILINTQIKSLCNAGQYIHPYIDKVRDREKNLFNNDNTV